MALDLQSILQLVAATVPTVKAILDLLRGAQTAPNQTDEVLDLISNLSPTVAKLVSQFDVIRTQTEAQYPQVWAAIRADYMAVAALNDQLNKPV